MTWDEMEKMVREAYLEGLNRGLQWQQLHGSPSDDQRNFFWECSDAAKNLPETTA